MKQKKPYTSPKLIIYGRARILTQGGTTGRPEGPSKSPNKKA